MKPAFALSFSENGISLHHQSDGDWYCIGTVPLDAPDFTDQMQALRDQGFALENDLSCKLVIPSDQVRLLTVDTDGLGPDEAAKRVEDTLASATPYELSELSYVTGDAGTETPVAAVARQTLDEARAFATDHGYIPEAFWVSTTGNDTLDAPFLELPIIVDEVAEVAAPEPDDTPEIPVHAIAEDAEPPAFEPATNALPSPVKPGTDLKRFAIPAIAASVVVGMLLGVWSFNSSDPEIVEVAEPLEPELQPEPEIATAEPQAQPEPQEPEIASLPQEPAEDEPALTATDEAILEALKIEPEPVEDIEDLPESRTEFREFTGTAPAEPSVLNPAPEPGVDDQYLTSVDRSNLSTDTVALPEIASLDTDAPFDAVSLPSQAGQRFELDERGLVTPSAEGTLNPAGVMVYLGRPSSVPPEPPTRFETKPVIIEEVDERLAAIRPRPRPENLVDQFERQQLGGRSRQELASVRPKLRPESLQAPPQVDETPTALAVVRVPRPKIRPAGIAPRATQQASSASAAQASTANVDSNADEVGSFQPRTVNPKIPSSASVARQATIDNAINLRKLNLIGVYGTPANRRALVRLPSGRYKKLKVGDRIDGGNVVAIGDSELRYQKRGKNITLKMPRG